MVERDLIDAFNDCIDRLSTGQNVDAVLSVYPQYADRLGVLLRVTQTASAAISLPQNEVAAARERVRLTVLEALAAAPPLTPQFSVVPRARRLLSAAAVLLIVGFIGVMLAMNRGQQQFATIESLTPPSVTPSETAAFTATSSPSPSPTPTATVTGTSSATPTPSASSTSSDTPSPSPSATSSETATHTPSPTATDTAGGITRTPAESVTPTRTASATRTPTASKTPTRTPTGPRPEGSATATPAVTTTSCVKVRPTSWVTYSVQAGDTLSRLASATGTTTQELIRVNCIVNPNVLRIGALMFLPRTPTTINPGTTPGGSVPNPTSAPFPGNPTATEDPPDDDDDDSDNDDDDDDDDDDDNSGPGGGGDD